MIGFSYARSCFSVEMLAEGMGLKSNEWLEIKNRGCHGLGSLDVEALDAHYDT